MPLLRANAAGAAVVSAASAPRGGALAMPDVNAFAVSIDATRVDEGARASGLAGSALWPQGQRGLVRSLWKEMKAALHAAKQDWQVWTIWYEDRFEGRVNDEERELAYVRIEQSLWNQGSAIVNAEVRRMIEEHEPPQSHTQEPKRSPIGLSMLDGFPSPARATRRIWNLPLFPKFHRNGPPLWNRSGPMGNWSCHLIPPAPTATPMRSWRRSRSCVQRSPNSPTMRTAKPIWINAQLFVSGVKPKEFHNHAPAQDELFRLAHAKEFLEGYAGTVNKEWPDFLAQRFHVLTLHFDRTVRQFPKWREFVRNADKDRLTSERAAEVPAIAKVWRRTTTRSNRAGYALLAEDVLESINNILKATAEGLLVCVTSGKAAAKAIGSTARETAAGFASEARKSIVDEGKRLRKGTGPALTKWGKRNPFRRVCHRGDGSGA